jgi:hypothetical protein
MKKKKKKKKRSHSDRETWPIREDMYVHSFIL